MKAMKRCLSLILCVCLLAGVGVFTANAEEKTMERYEQRFKDSVKQYSWGEDDFYYRYHEICDYYSVLNDTTAGDAEPDWVLINACGPASVEWDTYTVIGDRVLFGDGALPFDHYYAVYDVRRDSYASLESAWNSGEYPELQEKVEEYKVGYPIGDADMDHNLTILDATRIQRILADLEKPIDGIGGFAYSEKLTSLSDYDRDGERTVLDATAIQRRLAGMEKQKPSYVHSGNRVLGKRVFEGDPIGFELLEKKDDFFDVGMYGDYRGALIQSPEELSDFLGKDLENYGEDFFADNAVYAARVMVSRGYLDNFSLRSLTAAGEYLYPHFAATGYRTSTSGRVPAADSLYLYRIDKAAVQNVKALIASADPSTVEKYSIYSMDMGKKNLMHLPRSTYEPKLLEQGDFGGEYVLTEDKLKQFNFAVISSPRQMLDFLGKTYDAYDEAFFADKKLLAAVYRDNPDESIYRLREVYGCYEYEEAHPSNISFRVEVTGELSDAPIWKYAFFELTDEDAASIQGVSVWNAAGGISENIYFKYHDYFNPYYDMSSQGEFRGYKISVTDRKTAETLGNDFYMPEDGSPYCTIFYTYDEYIHSPIVTKPDERYNEDFFSKRCLVFFCKTYTSRSVIKSDDLKAGSDEAFSYHVPTIYVLLNGQLDEDPEKNVTSDYNFWITAPKPTYTESYQTIQWTEKIQ